jgi:hypothetical protein
MLNNTVCGLTHFILYCIKANVYNVACISVVITYKYCMYILIYFISPHFGNLLLCKDVRICTAESTRV